MDRLEQIQNEEDRQYNHDKSSLSANANDKVLGEQSATRRQTVRQTTRPQPTVSTAPPGQQDFEALQSTPDLIASVAHISSELEQSVQDFEREMDRQTAHQSNVRNMPRQSRFLEDLAQPTPTRGRSTDPTLVAPPPPRPVRRAERAREHARQEAIEIMIRDSAEDNRTRSDIGDSDGIPLAALRGASRTHQFRSLVPRHEHIGQHQRPRDKEWGVLKGKGHNALGDPNLTYNGRRTLFDYAFNQLHIPQSRATGGTTHNDGLDWGAIEISVEPYYEPRSCGGEVEDRMITADDVRKLIALLRRTGHIEGNNVRFAVDSTDLSSELKMLLGKRGWRKLRAWVGVERGEIWTEIVLVDQDKIEDGQLDRAADAEKVDEGPREVLNISVPSL